MACKEAAKVVAVARENAPAQAVEIAAMKKGAGQCDFAEAGGTGFDHPATSSSVKDLASTSTG